MENLNNSYRHEVKDKRGADYIADISFTTFGMLPIDYISLNKYVDYKVVLTHRETGTKREFTATLPSSSLFHRFSDISNELDLKTKADRLGDVIAGVLAVDINIDFAKHYEDMIVNMVNDFVGQFDALPIEDKKTLISNTIESGNKSLTNLVCELFESTVEIKNFLAIDSTGQLKRQMEKTLDEAVKKGRINLNSLMSDRDRDREEHEYDY